MADRIKGITIVIDGDATPLSKALKEVNDGLRQSQNELKDVNRLLKLDPGNTELLQQKYKDLGDAIDGTKKKLETLKDAASQMKDAGQTDTADWDKLQREIVDTEQKLKSLNQEMKDFGSVSAQKVAAAGEKVKSVGDGITNAGTKLLPATAALTAVGAAGVASFAEVDKTMQLTNKTMGNTEEQAELLNKAMKDAAANSTFGMKDAATATLNFARAGLDAEQAAAALAPAMNLAAGEGGDLDTVSAGLVATINGFHGSFEDAGTYADVFAAACNNSALDVDGLSHAMSVAAPIFSSAGYSVNDAALYMGVMANNGIDADKAANSLKTGLARLVSPAKEGATMMDSLGISVTNADGTMKDSVTVQSELHDAFSKLSESEQIAAASAIFGKNQMAPWLALINTAPEDVGKLNESLETCAGTTDEMAEAMMSGFGGSLEKLKSSIDVLVTSVGEALAPTIQKVAEFIQGLVDKFNAMSPAQQETVAKIGMIIAAAGPLLIVIGNLTTAIGHIMTFAPTLVTGFKIISGIITGTAIPAIGGVITAIVPFLPIIVAVAAAIAGIILIVKNWGAISEWFKGVWDKLCSGIKTAWGAVTSFFTETLPNFFSNLASKWSEGWNAIKSKAGEIWESTKQKASEVFGNIRDTVSDALSAAKEKTSQVLSEMKNTYQENGGGIQGIVSVMAQGINTINTNLLNQLNSITGGKLGELLKAFSDKFSSIRDTVGNIMSSIINNALKWGSDLVNGIANGIRNAAASVRDAVSNIANTIASFLHFSVPDEGPLTEYEKWMPDFMNELARSIEMNRGVIRKAIEGVSQDMVITQGFTVSGSPGEGAALNAGSMKTMLSDMVSKINSGTQGRDITVVLEMNRHEFGRGVFKANNEETQRYGVSLGGLAY